MAQPTAETADVPSSRTWSWVWVGALLGILLALVWWQPFDRGSRGDRHPAVGLRLPSLALVGLTGGARDLTADDLRGKVTLLNYWGTWCPPCVAEFPHLAELARTYRDDDQVRVVLVSCPYADDGLAVLRDDTEAFLAQRGVHLPIHAEPPTGSLGPELLGGRRTFPTTLVVDARGVVRGCWLGYRAGQETEMGQLVAELSQNGAASGAE